MLEILPEDELAKAQAEIKRLVTETGVLEPDRGEIPENIKWRFGRPPDYTAANLSYLKGKTRNHRPGSLELLVENMVKRWEMEGSHFLDYDQWTTIEHAEYCTQANGGKIYQGKESKERGNYNWLMDCAPKDMYDSEKETFESSHAIFRSTFPNGFAWEILDVFSGPPKVSFSWRHWATFDGQYKDVKGSGEFIEMIGSGVITLRNMKVTNIEIFYKPEEFLNSLLKKNAKCKMGEKM